jgi:putative transposase
VTKNQGARAVGLAMILKLMEAAEGKWRRLNGHHLDALLRVGATFKEGELVEGSEEKAAA